VVGGSVYSQQNLEMSYLWVQSCTQWYITTSQ